MTIPAMQRSRGRARGGFIAPLVALMLSACAAAPRSGSPPSPPNDVHWFRNSAERQAVFAQSYAFAWRLVQERLPGLQPGRWAVILDVDETVLDNSEHLRAVARARVFDPEAWRPWVQARRAPAFPQAREFVLRVQAAGGRIFFVTNRDEASCEDTRVNLRRESVPFDAVLCATTEPPEKETRFAAIRGGEALPGAGPLEVVLHVGDNIRDCASQTQAITDFMVFGTRCIALPNPMYGSWQGQPDR